MKKYYHLVEEVRANGDVFYFTTIDDIFVDDSVSTNKEKAEDIFEKIVDGSFFTKKTILKIVIKEEDEN